MLADTVEAACHTLENPTSQRLDKFITMLITQKVENKQLDNCDLTFRDILKIKTAFVNLLTGYYHNRIKYQNQQDPDEAPAKTEEASPDAAKEVKEEKVVKEVKTVKEQKENSESVKTTKTSAGRAASSKTSKEKK